MKFLKGFLIGTFVGVTIGTAINDQQRRLLVEKLRKQGQPIGQAVSDNVSNVADAAVAQATEKIDSAGSAVVDSIDDSSADPLATPTVR